VLACFEGKLRAKDAETAEQRIAAEQARAEAQAAQDATRTAEEQAKGLRQAEEARKGSSDDLFKIVR
jgi:hypothetical protein